LYRVSVTFDFSLFIFIASRARIARLTQIPLAVTQSKPIEQAAYGALDGARIAAAQAVKKAASDQRVDVGIAHFDRVAPEAALPALAKPRHPGRARTLAAVWCKRNSSYGWFVVGCRHRSHDKNLIGGKLALLECKLYRLPLVLQIVSPAWRQHSQNSVSIFCRWAITLGPVRADHETHIWLARTHRNRDPKPG
jgi:hypothetical protein